MRRWFQFTQSLFSEFTDDECMSRAGALAYYAVLSLPPLLVMILTVLSLVYGHDAAQAALQGEVRGLLGEKGGEAIQTMLANAKSPARSALAFSLWLGALVLGSSGVFAQLQAALNRIWEVKPDPAQGGVRNFIFKRLLSFSMVLGIAFLLLVSLVVSAALGAFGTALEGWLPAGFSAALLRTVNFAVSFGVITLLFAAMFKVLPDLELRWRHVWAGAAFTALLFVIGKFAIGLYLGKSDVGGAYGAAGSLVLVLVWLYYSSVIFLLGAEFTQVWARRHGAAAAPEAGATQTQKIELGGAELGLVGRNGQPPCKDQIARIVAQAQALQAKNHPAPLPDAPAARHRLEALLHRPVGQAQRISLRRARHRARHRKLLASLMAMAASWWLLRKRRAM